MLTLPAPVVSPEMIDGVIIEELGASSATLFGSFSATPLAAASLAQVHRATLKDGTLVAVKVQYPELRTNMASDLAVFRTMGAQVRFACSNVAYCVRSEHASTHLFADQARRHGPDVDGG